MTFSFIQLFIYVRHEKEEAALSSLISGLSSCGSESQSGVTLSLSGVPCRGYDSPVLSLMLERVDFDLWSTRKGLYISYIICLQVYNSVGLCSVWKIAWSQFHSGGSNLGPSLRPNPKKNKVHGTLCWSWLQPRLYVHSRIDSNTFTMGNPMPAESTVTLCQSRLYTQVRDFWFGLWILPRFIYIRS